MVAAQYTVVTSDDLGVFEDRINQLLGDGWILQGGVAMSALPQSSKTCLHVQWSQAMVLPSRPMPEAPSARSEALQIPEPEKVKTSMEFPIARPTEDQGC